MSFAKEKIGRLLKIGGEHLVYQYGNDQVIKFPNLLARTLFNNQKLAEKKKRDFALAKKYFPQYLLSTECVIITEINKPYYLIQPLINARPLIKKDLNNEEIRGNFKKILAINELIKEKEGLSFDFFGAWRLLFNELLPQLSINNLMLIPAKKIIILDVVFLEYQNCQWSKLLWLISRWAEKRQQRLLNKLLKNE